MRTLKAQHDLDLHTQIVGALQPRPWQKDGTPLDNVWSVYLGQGPNGYETIDINFCQLVRGWPSFERLTDNKHSLNLINLKLIIYLCLEPGPTGWIKSAGGLRQCFRKHLTFIRWKLDRNIDSNSSLSYSWFNDFHSSLRARGREGLLNLVPKAHDLIDAESRGLIEFQTDDRNGHKGLEISRLLGFSTGNTLTDECKNVFVNHFSKTGRNFTRRTNYISGERKVITDSVAHSYLLVWWQYWVLRDFFKHDPIGYKAFDKTSDIVRAVKGWATKTCRTPDVPAYQGAYLINSSLRLILDSVVDVALDAILSIAGTGQNDVCPDKTLAVNKRLDILGLPHIQPKYQTSKKGKKRQRGFRWFVFQCIPAAAECVIAAMSARRHVEIASIRYDCIAFDSFNEPWLKCYIAKNARTFDKVPIPMSAVRAVEVLKKIKSLSTGSKRPRLFDFSCPVHGRNIKHDSRKCLQSIAVFFGVPPLPNNQYWKFTPHQFRKFFGITYHWRWAFPNLTALTFHYRHFNPDTTRAYIEMSAAESMRLYDKSGAKERGLAALKKKSALARQVDLNGGSRSFAEWVIGRAVQEPTLGGALGRRIQAQVDALKDRLLVELEVTQAHYGAETFEAKLDELISRTPLKMHPEGHSICGCGDTLEEKGLARCLILRNRLTGLIPASSAGPDYGYADDTGCLVCPHRVALPDLSLYWDKAVTDARRAYDQADEEQRALLEERIGLITEYA